VKNTWMVSKYNNNISNFIEFYYYFLFLFNLTKQYPTMRFRKIAFFFTPIFIFLNHSSSYLNLTRKWNLEFNFTTNIKTLQIQLPTKLQHIKTENSDRSLVINTYSSLDKLKIRQKIFALFSLFNFSMSNKQFNSHPNSKLFYVKNFKKDLILIDIKKFFSRWKDSFDLIFHIFYYKAVPVVFSSPYFKNETLALNWNYTQFDINLWRYYFPFLTFKPNKYNSQVLYYFNKLATSNVDFFIVSDCAYHHKTTYYIRKKKLYSIGLVSINLDPWIVTYPIIGFFDSYVSQFFFLNF
jgi:hypothetical protein